MGLRARLRWIAGDRRNNENRFLRRAVSAAALRAFGSGYNPESSAVLLRLGAANPGASIGTIPKALRWAGLVGVFGYQPVGLLANRFFGFAGNQFWRALHAAVAALQ